MDAWWLIYALPALGLWVVFGRHRRKSGHAALAQRDAAVAAGLNEPASLHPVIDPLECIGCGSCVAACPEGRILGLVNGKAELVSPSDCIGHGACAAACPVKAIDLVFGTARRGVDIPEVSPDFQTNVPGLFIAGELGGMGLIRNAIEQGRQAMGSIIARKKAARPQPGVLDVVIVGAGPAGLSASLAALEAGLTFVTLDQDSLGGTVAHFPRGKVVMTQPAVLPMHGKVHLRETSKEALMGFWTDVVERTGLQIRHEERVEAIERAGEMFQVKTTKGAYRATSVLLAMGRRGTPRALGVLGEDLSKVVYRLIDPEQYRGRRVMVIGGGDSALEAAASLASEDGVTVTLSYRGDGFGRAKAKNREAVERLVRSGRLDLQLSTEPKEIARDRVVLQTEAGLVDVANDDVIICAGGVLPTEFLKRIGIRVERKHGTA